MAGYSFFRLEKLKTSGSLVARYNHDHRIVDVKNADPDRKDQNETLVTLPRNEDGEELDYYQAWKKRVRKAQDDHGWDKIRKNAVLAYDIVFSYSADFGIDVEEWKKRNVAWLEKTFNVSGDAESNVLSVVFHADESNYHCHAIVVPIDPRGRLNASYFTDGVSSMQKLQDSYAKEMSPLGLSRGVRGSSAHHKKMRHLYAELNNIPKIPEPQQGESASEYKERAEEAMQDFYYRTHYITGERIRRERQRADELIQKENAALVGETERIVKFMGHEKDRITRELEKEYSSLKKEVSDLKAEKETLEFEIRDLQEEKESLAREIDNMGRERNEEEFGL